MFTSEGIIPVCSRMTVPQYGICMVTCVAISMESWPRGTAILSKGVAGSGERQKTSSEKNCASYGKH